MGVCDCSMFCCTLLYVHSSIEIILMGKRELVALLSLSSRRLVMVVWLFLAVPWGCLRLVIVVFPDHTHLLFLIYLLGDETANSCSPRLYHAHANFSSLEGDIRKKCRNINLCKLV